MYGIIKWQNIKKLSFNTLALPYTASNEKFSLLNLEYIYALLTDHFWWWA